MFGGFKKTIIISVIDVLIILFIVLLTLVDINIGPIHLSSIKSIKVQHDKVKVAETELGVEQTLYEAALENLETQKDKYNREKTQYEAISDETVSIIREATAKENYSIEYMWIRLGNYAKSNNLSIILVEPGGSSSIQSNNTSGETQTTPVTSDKVDGIQSANKDETNDEEDDKPQDTTDKTLKIQVAGSYMNVSDFIFQVENDNDLKFKLDNISIEYVSGTTIRATFDVKNMIIMK